jgi:hypothetical protein
MESVSCVTNFCNGRLRRVKTPLSGWKVTEVPLDSFYRAINGFGLSMGDPASAAKFIEVIKTKKIVNALVEPVGQPERVIIKQLICEDGTRLHFDTSARGACCYFIEEPGPSCVEAFDAQYPGDAEDAAAGSNSDRKEVGRAAQSDSGADQRNGRAKPSSDAAASEQSGPDSVSAVSEAGEIHEVPTPGVGHGNSNMRL